MTTRFLLIVGFAMVCAAPALASEQTKAIDFIRFAENGNGIVIDLPGLVGALRRGADPNWIDRTHKRIESTLGYYVMRIGFSRDPAIDTVGLQAVKALVAAGAKLQPEDRSILYWPIARGKTEIVALLLDLGADPTAWPNKEIGTSYSPVEEAVREGHQEIVELLVARGATRPNERDAVQWRFVQAARHGSIELLDELLKKGANVNGSGPENELALLNAIDGGFGRCDTTVKVEYLLKEGADPNARGKAISGISTPLHRAVWVTSYTYVRKEDPTCSELLLSALIDSGAHISSLDGNRQTPLHIAAEHNHLFAAQLLLKAGAKVMPRDNDGKTPLDLAESGEMIKLLKSHGATER